MIKVLISVKRKPVLADFRALQIEDGKIKEGTPDSQNT